MSTFTSHLHQIDTSLPNSSSSPSAASNPSTAHNNPHATANPADLSALYRLVQDQMGVLALSAPTAENEAFLRSLVESLEQDVAHPPTEIKGVPQEFLDGLDRVPRTRLKADDSCPICTERYLDDQYCLVVELPCHHSHRFDLDCVGPWLRSKGSCPLCRTEMIKKREPVAPAQDDDEDEDDMNGLYA